MATAKAVAALAVDERRVDALDDVTTTPALLLCCGESGYWKLDRGVDRIVDSVWKLDRGVTDTLELSVSLLPRLPWAVSIMQDTGGGKELPNARRLHHRLYTRDILRSAHYLLLV